MEIAGALSAAALGYITMGSANSIKRASNFGYSAGMNYKKGRKTAYVTKANGYNKNNYYKPPVNSRRRNRFRGQPSMQKQIVSAMPAKHFAGEAPTSLIHNVITTMIPTSGIIQGTGNTQRVGDSITLCALKLKGFFNTDTSANAYSYRIIIGYTGEEFSGIGSTLGSGLGATELFLQNTTSTVITGIINPKAFTVLEDYTVDINSLIAATRDVMSYSLNVNLGDTRFVYQSNGSTQGKTRNLAIVVIGSVVAGASGVTAVGGTTLTWDLIFK